MSNLRADIESLKSAIDALLVSYPELAEDEVLRADMFEAETDLQKVMMVLVDKAQTAHHFEMAISGRIEELDERRRRFDRQYDAIRSLIQSIMERAELSKLTLTEATLSVSFRKPAPIVTDEAALPDECVKMVRKADMATIKSWCENGNVPNGVTMSNGRSVLSIRTR